MPSAQVEPEPAAKPPSPVATPKGPPAVKRELAQAVDSLDRSRPSISQLQPAAKPPSAVLTPKGRPAVKRQPAQAVDPLDRARPSISQLQRDALTSQIEANRAAITFYDNATGVLMKTCNVLTEAQALIER